ncbi:MAG: alpha-2-macroglobulin family protein [Amaricoccus sp.]
MSGRRLVPAALGLICALLPAGIAAAESKGALPERRVTVEAGVDFYGSDLRSIYGTTLPICRDACLAEDACTAFTFNTRASACFLKSDDGARTTFPAALSATLAPQPAGLAARAAARAATLGFLPTSRLEAARDAALSAGFPPAPIAEADVAARLATLEAEVNRSDSAAAWAALADFATTAAVDDYGQRTALRDLAVAAGINAYLRAGTDAEAGEAARLTGVALEADGEGRASLDALRLAADLAPGPAIAAAVERAEGLYGFRVTDRQVDFEAASPRACFTFSEPLAAACVDYADFVRVDAGTFPVAAEGSQLCLDGLAHGSHYQVTLRAGLPSAGGETLRASVGQEVYVRDRTPAVRFAGRAYVLPKSAEASVPIVAVNTGAAALKLYRVGTRNVATVLGNGDFGSPLTGTAEAALRDTLGEPVWQGTGELGQELNKDVTTTLPMGDVVAGLAPGLYVLTARVADSPAREDWEATATQWFVVTDLGIATLTGADGLHVFLRGLSDATARAGVTVKLLARNNDVLGEAATDADGHARFDPGLLRGRGGAEPGLVTAEAGQDYAFLSLAEPGFDLSDRGVAGRPAPPPVDVFVSTERGAYRPGETVFATVLARDDRARAIDGLTLTAIVTRADGVEYGRFPLPDQGAGGRTLTLPIGPGAPTGGWRLAIHADPEAPPLATTSFLVEDFTPERVDLKLTLPDGPIDPAKPPVLDARADFLWGAPGADLALEGETRVAMARDVPGRPGFLFGLEDEPFDAGYAALNPATTGADGTAELPLVLPQSGPVSRPLTLTATLRVRDGSGRPVERSLTRPLLPPAPLIGVRPLFDGAVDQGGTAGFEAIALGPDLAPTELKAVGWTLSRIDTDFQWYEQDGVWNYQPVTRRSRVANGTLDLSGTPQRLDLPVDWGRYELSLAATDGRYIATSVGFDAGWGAAAAGSETPDFLALSLDRKAYAVGDTARARVVVPNPGQLLVAVMGDRLIEARTLPVPAGEAIVDLPVTDAWGAGAYVTATLIRPMDVAAGHNPARAIGLAWAPVDPGPRRLAVAFEGPAEASPRTTTDAVLKIGGLAPGAKAYATIAAVDVGILNLTGFEAPDPDGHYFGQRRLGVEMRDVYGRLIDGLAGTPGRLRSGGDAGLGFRAPPPTERLVATFSGVLEADADGRVRAPVSLPDFNGTVRLMAVAWSADGVGQATRDWLVRDPVVVQASLPLFLAPGDSTRLRLDLAHAKGPAGDVSVTLTGDPGLLPDGGSFTGTLADKGRLTFEAALAGTTPGDHSLTVDTVTPAGEHLLKQLTVPVRANDPELARQDRIELAAGQTVTLDAAVLAGLAPGTAHATVALGPLAAFDVPGLLTSLEAYPWSCTEQTVSRAMPLLYFTATAEALGIAGAAQAGERIDEAIRRVLANQNGAGGFGLWSAEASGDGWLDAYVTDFLSRARAQGHPVPDFAFRSALANLTNLVNGYPDFEKGGEDLAYALLVLAREGRAAIGDLRYYADTRAGAFATPFAQAQLGAALALAGDQPRADAMFRRAGLAAQAGEPEQLFRTDYGTGMRDAAGVLALAAESGSDAVDRAALAGIVTAPRTDLSTQEQLWTLIAAHALAGDAALAGISVNDAPATGPALRLAPGDLPVRIANAGGDPTLAVVTAFGIPTQPEPAQGNGYRIERQLLTLDGKPADPAAIALDDRLVAVVTVTPERDIQARLIVSDPLPAGLEIENPNLLRSGETGQLAWLDADDVATHAEFRADRFAAAVDWQGAAPFRLAYMVRAVSPGTFHRPAASVEDMYRPAYRARTDAGSVTVKP